MKAWDKFWELENRAVRPTFSLQGMGAQDEAARSLWGDCKGHRQPHAGALILPTLPTRKQKSDMFICAFKKVSLAALKATDWEGVSLAAETRGMERSRWVAMEKAQRAGSKVKEKTHF